MEFSEAIKKLKNGYGAIIVNKNMNIDKYMEVLDLPRDICERMFGHIKDNYFPTLDLSKMRQYPVVAHLENISRCLASENISSLNKIRKNDFNYPAYIVLDSEWDKGDLNMEKIYHDMYMMMYNGDYVCHHSLYECVKRLNFFEKAALSMHAARDIISLEMIELEPKFSSLLDNICVGFPGFVVKDLPQNIYAKHIRGAVEKIWQYISINNIPEKFSYCYDMLEETVYIPISSVEDVPIESKDIENITEMIGGLSEGEMLNTKIIQVEGHLIITNEKEIYLPDIMEDVKEETVEEIEEKVKIIEEEVKKIQVRENSIINPHIIKYNPFQYKDKSSFFLPDELMLKIYAHFSPFLRFYFRLVSKQSYNIVAQMCSSYYERPSTLFSEIIEYKVFLDFGEASPDVAIAVSKGVTIYDFYLGRDAIVESYGHTPVSPISYLKSVDTSVMNRMIFVYEVFRELFFCANGTYRFYFWFDLYCKIIKEYLPAVSIMMREITGRRFRGNVERFTLPIRYFCDKAIKYKMKLTDKWKWEVMKSYGLLDLYWHMRLELINHINRHMKYIDRKFLESQDLESLSDWLHNVREKRKYTF